MTYLGIHSGAAMRRKSPTGLTVLALIVGFSHVLSAQAYGYATQGISVQLSSAGVLSVPANLSLTTSGSTFNNFSGSIAVNYKARTTPTGSASLTVKANSEFSPTGGPTLSNGDLTFTCGSPGLGTSCASAQTVSTSVSRTVVSVGSNACTGGGGSCSSSDPASVQLSFTLANTPQHKTGTYSTSLLFTISVV
ncbi:MAG: hypothetical protein JNN08_29845 [Bryobacterales bacterium]|nr:hypothetical protein [Bryobacterales bacterium]